MNNPFAKASMLALLILSWGAVPNRVLAADGPPVITTQPISRNVLPGNPVFFRVVAEGTTPFTYQWWRSGTAITDATNSTYTLLVASAGDDGVTFNVTVTNSLGGVLSSNAVLFVYSGNATPTNLTILPFGATWRYKQGADQGTLWKNPGFDDTAWPSGPGVFDAKSTPRTTIGGETVGTQLSLFIFPDTTDYPTYYFRTHITNSFPGLKISALHATALYDDGAAIYINGQDANRLGVDPGATYTTWANRTVGDAAYETFDLPVTNVVGGDNVIAGEAHQINATSSDITFGLRVTADLVPSFNAPTISSITPVPGATVLSFTGVEVFFNQAVQGVDASDLLINGTPATSLSFGVPGQYFFQFSQPPTTGVVQMAWAPGHGIMSLDAIPFDFTGSSWTNILNPNAAPVGVIINEFMAANGGKYLRDEDGDSSDWIELYNASPNPVNLTGYILTTSTNSTGGWTFPNVSILPNAYMIVFASGKDRTNAAARLHTDFQLNKDGEYLALLDPARRVLSAFAPVFPVQFTDVSYGRDRLDPTFVGYYTLPTPGAANTTAGSSGFASDVVFSRPSGTFSTPFSLVLTTASTNAVIRFVIITNASQALISNTNVPTASSPVYTSPIPVTATTQVRARAFETGLFPSTPLTESYILIGPDVLSFTSDRPMCIVHNIGAGAVPATPQTGIFMTFDNTAGRSSLTNTPQQTTRMGFHIRGSSTLNQAKSNYRLEYWDEFNQDNKLPFLDMPAESDWVLYGIDGFDPGLMHNAIFHWMGKQVGQFASRTRYVEVFRKIDTGPVTMADYFGLYLAEENPKIGKDRLDIANLQPQNTNLPAITGGYLMRIDRAGSGYNWTPAAVTLQAPQTGSIRGTPAPININDPRVLTTSTDPSLVAQRDYIRGYIGAFITNLATVAYTNPATGYAQYIDPDQWADHLIANIICFNVDGYRLSGYIYKDRNDRLKQGPFWDCDRCMGTGGTTTPQADNRCFSPRYWRLPANDLTTDNGTDFFGLSNIGVSWFERLFRDADFWQRFIDRYQMWRTNQYSTNAIFGMINTTYNDIKEAQVREQGKWGPLGFNWPRSGVQTVNGYTFDFGPADNAGRGRFINEVNFQKQWYADRLEFMDTNFLSMPTLSSGTALVPSGTIFTATPAAKTGTLLLYTLDGTDPRLPGGGISPAAKTSFGTLTLTVTNNVRLFARSYNTGHANMVNNGTEVGKPLINSFWSGPVAATYYTVMPSLRITELMYHPAPMPGNTNDSDNFEFMELANIGNSTLSLVGFRLTNGVTFTFTATNPVTSLAPGGHVLIVKSLAAFALRYPSRVSQVAGQYVGNLNNGGDRIFLEGPLGEPILDFNYHPADFPTTDGLGFSLVPINENAPPSAWDISANWRASAAEDGSPGQPDGTPVVVSPIFVNELLSNPDPLLFESQMVELYNPNAGAVDISGWFLTDNRSSPKKFRIPGSTIIPGGSYQLVPESAFNPGGAGFSFSPNGEEIYLFSGNATTNLTGYSHGYSFGAAEKSVTFGRYVNSQGNDDLVAQIAPTLGTNNTGPLVGPVVINEIMYHPALAATNDPSESFIELQNITGTLVALYNTAQPTNTWRLRNAVDFDFPPNVVLPAGGRLLVVGFNPLNTTTLAAFRTRYGLSSAIPIYGPWQGGLDNNGETIELKKPDLATAGNPASYVLVDKVHYANTAPWPTVADGLGASLNRLTLASYGNDVTNWFAALPSPGTNFPSGDAPAISVQPQSRIANGGSNVTFSVSVTGTEPFSYRWQFNGANIANATNATLTLSNLTLANIGQYQVVIVNRNGAIASDSASLQVLVPITISAQPQGATAFPYTNLVIYVTASGTMPLGYQWRLNGTNIAGANSPTLTKSSLLPADAGNYSVLVSNSFSSLISATATVSVIDHPIITQQPFNQAVNIGTNVTLSVTAISSSPLRYQWWFSNAFNNPTVALPSATNSSLIYTNVQTNNFGTYSVVVNDNFGSVTSAPVEMGFRAKPFFVMQPQPSNQVAVVGSTISITASVGGTLPINYRWPKNGSGGTWYSILDTNISMSITNVQLTNAGFYRLFMTNLATIVLVQSLPPSYLTVIEPLTNQAVRPGSDVTFSFGAATYFPNSVSTSFTNYMLRYQWWFNDTNLLATVTNISTATNISLVLSNVQAAQAGTYTVVASNGWGTMFSQSATVAIARPPSITQEPSNHTVLVGGSATFTAGVDGSDPLSYQWFYNGAPLTEATALTLILNNIQLADAGAYRLVITNSEGSVTSQVATLTVVNSEPLKFGSLTLPPSGGGPLTISFSGMAGESYSVLYRDVLDVGDWQVLTNIPTLGANQAVNALDAAIASRPQRFYRIVTPMRQP